MIPGGTCPSGRFPKCSRCSGRAAVTPRPANERDIFGRWASRSDQLFSFMETRDNEFPSFELNDQVALVTGAARGLGRAISLALAHAGAHVALGLRDVSSAADLVREIQSMGRKALPLQMDVTRLDQISRAVQGTVDRFGRLDILVNNAGIAPENPAENYREEDFDLTLAVNLKGTFFASQAAGRFM